MFPTIFNGGDSILKQSSVTLVVFVHNNWTPELYLATLQRSIKQCGAITIETVKRNHEVLNSLNDIHCYFLSDIEKLDEQNAISGNYFGITGGRMMEYRHIS